MNVPGENLKGVYSANEYLTRVNLMGAWNPESRHAGPARPARSRSSAAATSPWTPSAPPSASAPTRPRLVYRRSRDEMPARDRGGPPRRGGGRPVRAPDRPDRGPRRRERLGHAASAACAWSWASPTPPAAAARCPIAGSRVRHRLRRWSSWPSARRPIPLLTATAPDLKLNKWGNIDRRRARHDQHARRLRRRRHRPRRAPPSSWPWATASARRRPSTPTCKGD